MGYDELNDPDLVDLRPPPGIPADRQGGKVYVRWGDWTVAALDVLPRDGGTDESG
jgi:hypothetical protein